MWLGGLVAKFLLVAWVSDPCGGSTKRFTFWLSLWIDFTPVTVLDTSTWLAQSRFAPFSSFPSMFTHPPLLLSRSCLEERMEWGVQAIAIDKAFPRMPCKSVARAAKLNYVPTDRKRSLKLCLLGEIIFAVFDLFLDTGFDKRKCLSISQREATKGQRHGFIEVFIKINVLPWSRGTPQLGWQRHRNSLRTWNFIEYMLQVNKTVSI